MRYPSNPTASIRKEFARGASSSGKRLAPTPYNPKWGDCAIPSDIRAFFAPGVFQDPADAELRKEFISADAAFSRALHVTPPSVRNKQVPINSTLASTLYVEAYEAIKARMAR
jgi:hypothetical protein